MGTTTMAWADRESITMPKPKLPKTTGYTLPTPHRIRLLKDNIRVLEGLGCELKARQSRQELLRLQKKLWETPCISP